MSVNYKEYIQYPVESTYNTVIGKCWVIIEYWLSLDILTQVWFKLVKINQISQFRNSIVLNQHNFEFLTNKQVYRKTQNQGKTDLWTKNVEV